MPLEWLEENETVKIEPDEFSDVAFICLCGEIVPADDIIEVEHQYGGIKALLPRCPSCAPTSLCSMNLYGVHGSVVTPEDPEFDREIVIYEPFPAPAPGQFFRYLSDERLDFPNAHQYGYCNACGQPMQWIPSEFRWRDWSEARKAPRQ